MRSILLDRDELAWLVRIFEDLVVVEDSRVFWNQSQPGFPRILAQHCFNRHGGFLVVEEFNSDRKSGSVLIPEGRTSKGWELFGSVLHLAFEHFRVGFKDVVAETEVQTGRDSRRRYAEVLAKSLPSLEEPFGVVSGLVARVPRCGRLLRQIWPSFGIKQAENCSSGEDYPCSDVYSYGSGEDYTTSGKVCRFVLWF